MDSVVRKAKESTVLAWHPSRKVLAVGWETGEITARNEQENELYEFASVHRSEITILQWTSNGSRLVSADAVCCCGQSLSFICLLCHSYTQYSRHNIKK